MSAQTGMAQALEAARLHWANKRAAEGSLAGCMTAAADLAAAGDKMERVRAQADRDADEMRARMAVNAERYWRER